MSYHNIRNDEVFKRPLASRNIVVAFNCSDLALPNASKIACGGLNSNAHTRPRPEAAEGNEKWGVKDRALMASAGARAYNGGLGAEPPAPWSGSLPEAE